MIAFASPRRRSMRLSRHSWAAWSPLVLLLVAADASSALVTFTLDPARSTIELSGTVNAFGLSLALKEQAPSSLDVPWTGASGANVSGVGIEFVTGNRITLPDSRNWEPGPYGVPGVAPASYGMLASVELGSIAVIGKIACRHWSLDTFTTNLTLQDGTFLARRVRFPFFDETNSVVDYHFLSRTGGPGDPDFAPSSPYTTNIVAGRHIVSGSLTNRATNSARVAIENGLETLRVPMDAIYTFTVTNGNNRFRFSMVFTGELVGVVTPKVEIVAPQTSGQPFRVSWPLGYKLQRATRLADPDWTDHSSQSPLEVAATGAAHYFRAVKLE